MDAGKTDSCQRGGVGHWVKEAGRNNSRPSGDSQRERGWGQVEVGIAGKFRQKETLLGVVGAQCSVQMVFH